MGACAAVGFVRSSFGWGYGAGKGMWDDSGSAVERRPWFLRAWGSRYTTERP